MSDRNLHDGSVQGRRKSCYIASFVLLMAFSTYLRLRDLDHESLWMDELCQVSYYQHSLREIIDKAGT